MSAIKELDEIMEETESYDESFRIDDLSKAIWADEKVRDAETKIAEIDRLADERIQVLQAKIDNLNEWREEAKKPYNNTIEFFKGHMMVYLHNFIQEQIKSGAKKITKTIKLPFRDLVFRSQQPEIVKDDELFLGWMEENAPEYVEQKPVLKWGDYKKTLSTKEIDGELRYVDENGQVVPHVKLVPRSDLLEWKVKE